MTALILALDVSSTTIGWCLYDGTVLDHGQTLLKNGDINHRCRLARAHIAGLLIQHPAIDAVAIEEPAGKFIGTVIPQCFVSGAIRSLLAEHEIAICDVPPAAAKKALTGRGNADKAAMQERAAGYGVCGEHASDALGVALAAVGMVKVVPV